MRNREKSGIQKPTTIKAHKKMFSVKLMALNGSNRKERGKKTVKNFQVEN